MSFKGQGLCNRCFKSASKKTGQKQGIRLNSLLIDHWYADQSKEDAGFLYIDGHIRIYYGDEANEPAFFHRLCETYRIAVVACRKNVKDEWPDSLSAQRFNKAANELARLLNETGTEFPLPGFFGSGN